MGSLELSNPGLTPAELDSIRSNGRRLWIAIGLILLFFLLAFAGWVAWKLTATGADHYTRALSQSEAGNFSSAVIELKNALTENPDDTAARLLLGSLYVELGDGNSGRKEYEIAAALGADAELSKLGLLRARFLQGGRREVISGLDGLASTHREAALLRGDVLTALGRLEPAEVAFTTLLDSNPKDIKALHGLARIGLERGDFDFAKKTLETAQSLSTVSVTGWLLQADVAFRTQEFGQARAAFEEALLRQPDHFGARVGLVRSLLELREPAATKSHLDELHQISPQMPLVNYLRGVAAAQLGEPALAQEALLSTLRVARHHVDARTLLASIFYQQGQMEEAKEAILQVLRRRPGHVASRKLLAAVYIASGRFGDAITSLEVALDSAPGDAELLAMLGQAYLGKGCPMMLGGHSSWHPRVRPKQTTSQWAWPAAISNWVMMRLHCENCVASSSAIRPLCRPLLRW